MIFTSSLHVDFKNLFVFKTSVHPLGIFCILYFYYLVFRGGLEGLLLILNVNDEYVFL